MVIYYCYKRTNLPSNQPEVRALNKIPVRYTRQKDGAIDVVNIADNVMYTEIPTIVTPSRSEDVSEPTVSTKPPVSHTPITFGKVMLGSSLTRK